MAVLDNVIRFIISGSIGGLPTVAVMILPFVIDEFWEIIHKFLKIAVIASIISVVLLT